ncbi:MAG: hypothetical protein IPI46_00585 [Bacteroidetes bacterium]|nr:hypothetical protein [Bacteroidota bacterium]
MKRKINVLTLLILMYSIVICSVFKRENSLAEVSMQLKPIPKISNPSVSAGERQIKHHVISPALVSKRNAN